MARRFVFRLEAVLRLRKRAEEERQRAVAAAVGRVEERRRLLTRLVQRGEVETRRLRAAMREETLPVDAVLNCRAWIGRLRRECVGVMQELADAEQALAVERARLAEAAKQRKVLEKFKERRAAEYRRAQDRAETAFLDEIGVTRHVLSSRDREAES